MKAKDIIRILEEFDPESDIGVLVDTVDLAGRKYEKWNHFPAFTDGITTVRTFE